MDGQEHDSNYDLRHSAAHLMAQAVGELYPGVKYAIGPPIEDGFYYDFDLPRPIHEDDLASIEEKMREIAGRDLPIVREEMERETAAAFCAAADQAFKVELINDLPEGEAISFYRQGDWIDLCRGPHLPSTKAIQHFKLLSTAGAYWRGSEKNPMLTRIYGTAWPTAEELQDYLERLEEAKRRDHRKIGKDLDLFSTSDAVGPGLIMWHPKGAMVRVVAEDFCRRMHLQHGYDWVFTPHIGRSELWRTSGHLDFYADSMYSPMDIEGEDYYVKPMNCPFHIEIYKSHTRSYRDLPLRYAEFGAVYRFERSGVLHGLTRVRGFTQDDAHIFCRPDQMDEEISGALEFSLTVLRAFGLTDFHAYLATRPEKYVGEPEQWDRATDALEVALDRSGLLYARDEGGGAFYGPKIDLKVKDALGRDWQLSTIQFDFNLPSRFGLEYAGDDGQVHQPYMVHRALMGSMERFMGVLIEHHAGAFPLWLAPVQIMLLPITDHQADYAKEVAGKLKAAGFRTDIDLRSERVGKKIAEAEVQKVPYMLIMGKRDLEAGVVSVRKRGEGDLGAMTVDDLIAKLKAEVG